MFLLIYIIFCCDVILIYDGYSSMTRVAGLELRQALALFIGGRCLGLRWLGHSKHTKEHNLFILFEPLLGMPHRGCHTSRTKYAYKVLGIYCVLW